MKTAIKLYPLWLLAMLWAGCRSTVEPGPGTLAIPSVAAVTFRFHGTPLAGPLPLKKPPAMEKGALLGTVSFFALAALPGEGFEPLPLHTQWITVLRGGDPVSQIPLFTAGARMAILDDLPAFLQGLKEGKWGNYAPLTRIEANVDAGKTTVYRLYEHAREGHLVPDREQAKGAEIQIHYDAKPERNIRIALVVEDWLHPEQDEMPGAPKDDCVEPMETARDVKESRVSFLQREIVLLDDETSNAHRPLVIFFPSPFDHDSARALAAVIEPAPRESDVNPSEEGEGSACVRFHWPLEAKRMEDAPGCEADADSQRVDSQHGESETGTGNPALYGVAKVLHELPFSARQRTALIYLASRTHAGLALDLGLTAPDSLLFVLADRIHRKTDDASMKNLSSLGWMIESTAYDLLAERLAGPGLSFEVEALLARHAGEVGRDAASLSETLRCATGLDAFRSRLVYENLLFLEDASPAARCRAFDWLDERGRAPKDYDPLGTPKERRIALEGAFEIKDAMNSGDTRP